MEFRFNSSVILMQYKVYTRPVGIGQEMDTLQYRYHVSIFLISSPGRSPRISRFPMQADGRTPFGRTAVYSLMYGLFSSVYHDHPLAGCQEIEFLYLLNKSSGAKIHLRIYLLIDWPKSYSCNFFKFFKSSQAVRFPRRQASFNAFFINIGSCKM